MRKNIYITKKLYDYINKVAEINDREQMMVFGGKTIGNTIVIDERSFTHFNEDVVLNNDSESIEVPVKELEKQMAKNYKLGNDTFIMTHSHPCKSSLFEFMYGDLSDEDEVISHKLRSISNRYLLNYYDGITTGKKVYFWSTEDDIKYPQLMDCYVENEQVDYNALTRITEDIEHILKK